LRELELIHKVPQSLNLPITDSLNIQAGGRVSD